MDQAKPWCFILHVSRDTDLDGAWSLLEEAGYVPLYIEEDEGALAKIYIQANPEETIDSILHHFVFVESVELEELGGIDWKAQWAEHGLNFHDGYVHIDLPNAIKDEWKVLKMTPGAGFGDLSHSTTRLVLNLMENELNDKAVIDIGSGSGVLSICSVALGAKPVYGIEIDDQALDHSKQNAELNHMADQIIFCRPKDFKKPQETPSFVILMNMTMEEQRTAWKALPDLNEPDAVIITSGILEEQREAYLEMVQKWGWKLCDEQSENGWLGFKFH